MKDLLDHSRAAYLYACKSLPNQVSLPSDGIIQNGFKFEKESEVRSMLIELGWAFFCRYEAVLEKYIKEKGIKLSKNKSLIDWLSEKNVSIPSEYAEGLERYRTIRNILHHDDGDAASLDEEDHEEVHLLPGHMEKFYELFVWCGDRIHEKS